MPQALYRQNKPSAAAAEQKGESNMPKKPKTRPKPYYPGEKLPA